LLAGFFVICVVRLGVVQDGLPIIGGYFQEGLRDTVIKDTVQNVCMSNILYTILILSLLVNHICHIVSECYTHKSVNSRSICITQT